MNWQEYEHYCAKWWESQHPNDKAIVTKKNGKYGADGGVDLDIKTVNGQMLGQCKHYFKEPLKVNVVRELKGVMAVKGVDRGIIFTNTWFSKHAREFAKEANIWIQPLKA